jgi:hypothetical protein
MTKIERVIRELSKLYEFNRRIEGFSVPPSAKGGPKRKATPTTPCRPKGDTT